MTKRVLSRVRVVGSVWPRVAAVAAFVSISALGAHAQEAVDVQQTSSVSRGPSGLPLPRFVSLKSAKVNSRTGPGVNYAIEWMYLKAGLPVEILQEYDNWRRIRDSEGAEGWINQSLLSGKRTAIVAPWQKGKKASISLLSDPSGKADVVALLEPGVIGKIGQCNGNWCEMNFEGHEGWINQALLWGAYPDEQIDD